MADQPVKRNQKSRLTNIRKKTRFLIGGIYACGEEPFLLIDVLWVIKYDLYN